MTDFGQPIVRLVRCAVLVMGEKQPVYAVWVTPKDYYSRVVLHPIGSQG